MKKIVNTNIIFTHDLLMKPNSKIYMTGCASPNALLAGKTKEELDQMPGEHIEGDLVLESGDILIVDGNVFGMHGGEMESGCEVRKITKEQFDRAANGEELRFTKYSIKPNEETGGYYCFFQFGHDGPQYYASLCVPPGINTTECMIFKAKDGEVTDWDSLYAKRGVPFNEYGLDECVDEFVKSL